MQNQHQPAIMTQTSETTYEWSAPYHYGLIGALREARGRWDADRHIWVFTIPTENKGQRARLFKAISRAFPNYTWVDARNTPREPEPEDAPLAPGMARCEMCGDEVAAALLMTSAHGSVCPRCYDRAN